jgi:hypothetical protein
MENIQFFTILGSIIGSLACLIVRMDKIEERITHRINELEKDVSMIKGILSVSKLRNEA